jgi:hypothetical protein
MYINKFIFPLLPRRVFFEVAEQRVVDNRELGLTGSCTLANADEGY